MIPQAQVLGSPAPTEEPGTAHCLHVPLTGMLVVASSLLLFTWQTLYNPLLDPILKLKKENLKYREEKRARYLSCSLMFARHCLNCSVTI